MSITNGTEASPGTHAEFINFIQMNHGRFYLLCITTGMQNWIIQKNFMQFQVK